MKRLLIGAVFAAACGFSAGAGAQETLPASEPGPDAAVSPWSWFGDLMLREEHVTGLRLANGETTIQRVAGRGRFGVLYDPIPQLEFGAAIKLAVATNDNRDDRFYNLNERSNDIAADQLFARWRPGENVSFLVGKTAFPLDLTPLVWDRDLRPIGVSADLSAPVGEFDRVRVVAGYFAGDLPYGDDSRIGAIQLGYNWHEGAPTNAGVLVSYLDFSDLDQLVLQGQARTNRRIGNHLVSDYHLFDVQMFGRTRAGDWPVELRIDLLRNLGADDERDGARGSIVVGNALEPKSWEFGLSAQRIQRDAAMAAFNSDDWWFHSWARGVMPWVGYGVSSTWSVRLAGFHELRDGATDHVDTVFFDVFARW
ncbi:MAG TPA: hypothetical protein VF132_05260 [Rudaea sp.]